MNPGEAARTVYLIEFDPVKEHLNDYTATNQYRIQGIKQCREDRNELKSKLPWGRNSRILDRTFLVSRWFATD